MLTGDGEVGVLFIWYTTCDVEVIWPETQMLGWQTGVAAEWDQYEPSKNPSQTGNRTPAAAVRAPNPNH